MNHIINIEEILQETTIKLNSIVKKINELSERWNMSTSDEERHIILNERDVLLRETESFKYKKIMGTDE